MLIFLKGKIGNCVVVHKLPRTILDIFARQIIGAYEAAPFQIYHFLEASEIYSPLLSKSSTIFSGSITYGFFPSTGSCLKNKA